MTTSTHAMQRRRGRRLVIRGMQSLHEQTCDRVMFGARSMQHRRPPHTNRLLLLLLLLQHIRAFICWRCCLCVHAYCVHVWRMKCQFIGPCLCWMVSSITRSWAHTWRGWMHAHSRLAMHVAALDTHPLHAHPDLLEQRNTVVMSLLHCQRECRHAVLWRGVQAQWS